jgi:pyruvate formate lyase activating enzyme
MSGHDSNIVFAGLAPHPPIVVPAVGRGRERECASTVDALSHLARRAIFAGPDTIVVLSPHSPRRHGSFGYWKGAHLRGDFARFGAEHPQSEFPADQRFIEHLQEEAAARAIPLWPIGESHLDHGALVPLWYLEEAGWLGPVVVLGLNYPGESGLEALGEALAAAAKARGGRIAIIASGDMSHRLTQDAPSGYHPRGIEFDEEFIAALRNRDADALRGMDAELLDVAGQDVIETTIIALSATGFDVSHTEVLSYEGPFGVGYGVAVLYEEIVEEKEKQEEGRRLVDLARRTVEATVMNRKIQEPADRPTGYLARRAGVFVTLRERDGEVRGCLGTLGPNRGNLVEETIERAIAVAGNAYGTPVTEDELPGLRYEVSVLHPAEGVRSPADLDPSLYGVIMRDNHGRRAVLLPGIPSITTAEKQLSVVRRKGGIPEDAPVKLVRFRTDRFGEEESLLPEEADGEAFPARWWRPLEDGRVLCYLCPRECRIPSGSRGFCFVRKNENGRLVLTTYGRSSGFCIDPIEKKPLNHFLPGTPILSFGTAGCNLGCRFCQNHDISKAREMDRLMDSASPATIADTALHHGCRSVAFTYNDPVIFAEYAIDIAKACRERGIHTVAVTAGYISPEARPEFFAHMDAANVDLKAFTETFYKKLCFAEMRPVLDTLKYLKNETSVWFEVTTLLIPGENDSDEEVGNLSAWFAENIGPDVPLHFTAFHPDFKMLDTPRTPAETLKRAREIAIAHGLRYVYVGNIHDSDGGSTYCPGCGARLIERDWYQLGEWNLEEGRCRFCGETLPGIFDNRPGTWGSRRLPVRLST